MLPTFLIIGAPKAGTTSLHRYLGQHPDVYVPDLKEPCYFGLDDGVRAAFTGPGDHIVVNARSVCARDAYEALFEPGRNAVARGEASSQYLGMAGSAARVASAIPDCRIIVVLREPSSRAVSHWAMKTGLGYESLGFADALAAEDARLEQGYAPCWGYRRSGAYTGQLESWLACFAREQLKVVMFDDLRADAAQVLSGLFEFIGVDPSVRVDTAQRHNPTSPARNTWVHRVTRHRVVIRTARTVLPRGTRHRLLYQVDGLGRARPEPDAVDRLRSSLATEVDGVESLLGLDLSAWRR